MEQVRKIFAQCVDVDLTQDFPRAKSFTMSAALHELHLDLYRDVHIMLDQQDKVFKDGEHRQLIEEGLQMNMRMPHISVFKLRVDALRAHINTYNPFEAKTNDKGRVTVPVHVARGMNATLLLASCYVHDYFSELANTDYAKRIRQLREAGVPYAGPCSLQETFNTYIDLHYIAAQLEHEVVPVSKLKNWFLQPKTPENSRHIPDLCEQYDVKKLLKFEVS